MTTPIREESAGRAAVFLVPSLKLKDRSRTGPTLEDTIHRFLLRRFSGYTAAAGNIFGYWKDRSGREFYGEHKEYKVALADARKLPELKRFLASLAADMGEQCIYLEAAGEASFIYAAAQKSKRR